MGTSAPAFSFYAKDFMVGTAAMSLDQRGAYITLLSYQWDVGGVPDGAAAIGRILGCSPAIATRLWGVVGQKFQRGDDGQWRNARLEQERAKQAERRAVLAANGQKGGRPPKNRTDPQTKTKPEPTWKPEAKPDRNQNESLASSFSDPDPDLEIRSGSQLPTPDLVPPADVPPAAAAPERGKLVTNDRPDMRSKRPIFRCDRFVVFEWLFDDIRQLLGPHLNDFALDEWFYSLSAKADRDGLVLDKQTASKWVYDQTVAEAERRGLKVATVERGARSDSILGAGTHGPEFNESVRRELAELDAKGGRK